MILTGRVGVLPVQLTWESGRLGVDLGDRLVAAYLEGLGETPVGFPLARRPANRALESPHVVLAAAAEVWDVVESIDGLDPLPPEVIGPSPAGPTDRWVKHAGPGPHPGTGSPQEVHGGGGGGSTESDGERWTARAKELLEEMSNDTQHVFDLLKEEPKGVRERLRRLAQGGEYQDTVEEAIEALASPYQSFADAAPPESPYLDPEKVQGVVEYWTEREREVREQHGELVPVVLKNLQQQLEQRVEAADVFVRVPSRVLPQIVDDGRVRNQHETDTSGGVLDPEFRSEFESEWFRGSAPIYGYLSDASDGWLGNHNVDQYGDVALKLKPSVKHRTTFLWNDSLDTLGHMDWPSAVPSPVTHPSLLSAFRWWEGSISLREVYPYPEAQVHGGVRLEDIAEVIFDEAPDLVTRAALRQAKLKWRVV